MGFKSLERQLIEKDEEIRQLKKKLRLPANESSRRVELTETTRLQNSYKRLGLSDRESRIAAGVETVITIEPSRLASAFRALGLSESEAGLASLEMHKRR